MNGKHIKYDYNYQTTSLLGRFPCLQDCPVTVQAEVTGQPFSV